MVKYTVVCHVTMYMSWLKSEVDLYGLTEKDFQNTAYYEKSELQTCFYINYPTYGEKDCIKVNILRHTYVYNKKDWKIFKIVNNDCQ